MSKFKSLAFSHREIRCSNPVWAASIGAALLLALSGCAAVQVRLGAKVYLEKIPIAFIKVSQPKGIGIAPGEKSQLAVTLTEPNGTVWETEGAARGKILWKDLVVTTTVLTANQKGTVYLSSDPRLSDGRLPHVVITVPSHPDLRAELDIPVRYDHAFSSNYSGGSGSSGMSGTDGSDGMSGLSGSMDPNHPSAGGNGSDGGNGADGHDGNRGGDAQPVEIRVALRPGDHPLLQMGIAARGGDVNLYLVDPKGGSLTVSAEGGSGGSGGKGGRGGRGGSGGMGSPNGSSGSNGSDGRNGSDGSSGTGGRITVIYDPLAKPYLSAIHLYNGNGPRPVFKEEPVAPLW